MAGLRGIPATYGGVEKAVEEVAVRLAARGHEVTVFARAGYSPPGLNDYKGVRIARLPQINTKHLEAISHTALAAMIASRRGRYDVVHLHATGPALFSFLPRAAGVPSVVTVQGLDWQREKWGPGATSVLKLAARVAATVPDRTIVVSKKLRRVLEVEYGSAAIYIPNGVDVAQFRDEQAVRELEGSSFLLFLGRLVPEKGVHTLIEAFRSVGGDIRLAIAGPSSHSDNYVRQIETLATQDERVVLLGPRYGGERTWLLRHATLFVQPSTVEGLPLTLLEAMAAGTYAVVSDIEENVEAVSREGATHARTFRVGDATDLASVITDALSDEDRELEAAAGAMAVIDEYDWDRITEMTEDVYRDVVASRRRSNTPS
jgi:glycosyltransferase involved in cell wall biosynthesis